MFLRKIGADVSVEPRSYCMEMIGYRASDRDRMRSKQSDGQDRI
jgi:hypothetical protein